MSVEPKAAGFYREDAARLASEAAKAPQSRLTQPANGGIPSIRVDKRDRERLAPQAAVNQNIIGDEAIEPRPLPPRPNIVRTIAWVLLAPWYAIVVVGSLGIDAWFVKDLLGF